MWEGGELVLGPVVDETAINLALARIGIEHSAFDDEFEMLKLGRCRMTEDWLELGLARS